MKTSLTKRGVLPADKEPASNDFIAVQPAAPDAIGDQTEIGYCLTLSCGAVLEFLSPLDCAVLPTLLAAIQRYAQNYKYLRFQYSHSHD